MLNVNNKIHQLIIVFLFFIPILFLQIINIYSPEFWDDIYILSYEGFKNWDTFLSYGFKSHPVENMFFRPISNFSIYLTHQLNPILVFSRIFNLIIIFFWLLFIFKIFILNINSNDLRHKYFIISIIGFIAFNPIIVPAASWIAARGDLLFTLFSTISIYLVLSNYKFNKIKFIITCFFAIMAALSKDIICIIFLIFSFSMFLIGENKKSKTFLILFIVSFSFWAMGYLFFKEPSDLNKKIILNFDFFWRIADAFALYFKAGLVGLSTENPFKIISKISFEAIFFIIFSFSFYIIILYKTITTKKVCFAFILTHGIFIFFMTISYHLNWQSFDMTIFERYLMPTIPFFYLGLGMIFYDIFKYHAKYLILFSIILSTTFLPSLYFQMEYWSNPSLFWKIAQEKTNSTYVSTARILDSFKYFNLFNLNIIDTKIKDQIPGYIIEPLKANFIKSYFILEKEADKITQQDDISLFFAIFYEQKFEQTDLILNHYNDIFSQPASVDFWKSITAIQLNKCNDAETFNVARLAKIKQVQNKQTIKTNIYIKQNEIFITTFNSKCFK